MTAHGAILAVLPSPQSSFSRSVASFSLAPAMRLRRFGGEGEGATFRSWPTRLDSARGSACGGFRTRRAFFSSGFVGGIKDGEATRPATVACSSAAGC